MPFTASHVAAILPLSRTPLIPSALAIGSMAPDLPLFTSVAVDYGTTHSVAGAVTVDALLGVLLFTIWHALLAPAAVAALPVAVREVVLTTTTRGLWSRVSRPRQCLLLYASLVIGAMTHVGWDAFTHHGRWGVDHVPWLAQMHGPLRGHEYAQHASSLVGAAVIAWWCWRWLRRNRIGVAGLRLDRGARRALLAIVSAATVSALFAVRPVLAGHGAYGMDDAAFIAATTAIPAAASCAVLLATGWHALRLRP